MSDAQRGFSNDDSDNPGVVAPPPLIYAGALVLGLLLNRPLKLRLPLPRRLSRALGPALAAGGLALGFASIHRMRRAETNVETRKPTNAIVQDGPYRYTRNPIYVALTTTYGGLALFANTLPPFLLLPLVLRVMRRGVIEREERYLERKFGEEYLRYKSRVPRWL